MARYIKYGVITTSIFILPLLMQRTDYHYLIGIFTLIAIFGIVTVGYDLLLGFAGQLSVAQIAFFGIGAYGSALMTTKYNLSPILSLFIALVVCLGVAFVIGCGALKLKHMYLAIATMAFGEIFYRILIGFPRFTGGGVGVHVSPFSVLGFKFTTDIQFYYLGWSVALTCCLLANNMINSGWGRTLIAIHDDEEAAVCMGINVSKAKIQVFMISSAYASIAGSLYAHFQNFVVPDQFSMAIALDLILMIFMGGIRTIWGGFIGVIILQILPEILEWLRDYRPLVSGLVLVLILLFMPKGIAAALTRLWTNGLMKFKLIPKNTLNSMGGKKNGKR